MPVGSGGERGSGCAGMTPSGSLLAVAPCGEAVWSGGGAEGPVGRSERTPERHGVRMEGVKSVRDSFRPGCNSGDYTQRGGKIQRINSFRSIEASNGTGFPMIFAGVSAWIALTSASKMIR